MKGLENSFIKTCFKRCTDIHTETLDDSEKSCLNNCDEKMGRYFKIYKDIGTAALSQKSLH
jgi:hypothetical protein